MPIAARREHLVIDVIETCPGFVRLAIGQGDAQHPCAVRRQRRLKSLSIERGDHFIGDQCNAPLDDGRLEPIDGTQGTDTDMDEVTALAERYAEALHDSGSSLSNRATSALERCLPESTMRSATSP